MYKPPPSVPIATEHNPDDTNAAGPDEEPPVYLSIECGFLAVLQEKLRKSDYYVTKQNKTRWKLSDHVIILLNGNSGLHFSCVLIEQCSLIE